MSPACRFLLLFLAALPGAGAGPVPLSVEALEMSEDYVLRSWDVDDGLPSNVISGLAQTPDGYLWLSTPGGLARFDGMRFTVFSGEETPGLNHPAAALFVARDGALWVGLERHGVIRRRGGRFETVIPMQGVEKSEGWITSLTQAADGAIWGGFGPDLRAFRWLDGKVDQFSNREGIQPGIVTFIMATETGKIWFATSQGRGVFDGKKFQSVDPGLRAATMLTPSRQGGVWAAQGDRLLRYQNDGASEFVADLGWIGGTRQVSAIYEDRSSNLWIGTRNDGLLRFRDGKFERVPTSHNDAMSIIEDRDGNIWVGTRGGGVDRLRPRDFFLRQEKQGLRSEVTTSLAVDGGGKLWAVGLDGAPVWATDLTNSFFAPVPGWPGARAFTLCPDSSGGMWMGTLSNGLMSWRKGVFRAESLRESVTALHLDRRGDLWVATINGGVFRHRDGADTLLSKELGLVKVRAMAEDGEGAMWFGTEAGLVFRRQEERIVPVAMPGAKTGESIRFIVPDGPDTVWIGALDGGLYRWRAGKTEKLPHAAGVFLDEPRSLVIEPDGNFWIGTTRGLFRVARHEIEAAMDGRQPEMQAVTLGRNDGLPSVEFSYGFRNATVRTRDGHLWFATSRGALEIVAPERSAVTTVRPCIVIEDVQVGGVSVPLADGKMTALPPRPAPVQIRYTLPQLNAPEQIRFRYRLDGFNDGWVFADTQRAVTFTHLPPGDYRFVVEAAEAGGTWLPGQAAFAFTVRAAWWESDWFRASVLGGGILALAALVRWLVLRRVRTRMRALEQQHAVERERTRIARDVHDELGASLTQISIASQLARLDPPETSAGHLDEIAAITRRAVTSLDEIVWAVNPRNDTLGALLVYLGQYALDFLAPAGIACEVDIPEKLPARPLSAHVRHHLFLVVKEALNNVVKHSGASAVELKVEMTGGGLRLTLSDNGRGFAPGAGRAEANGLRNMDERMTEAGGVCRIESHPGKGTHLVFELPLPGGGA